MRVADKMIYGQINGDLHRGRTGMSEALERTASQKRINKPSDDPVAATRVLSYRTEDQNNQQYAKILTNAKSHLEYTEQSLGDLTEVLVRAKELTLGATNDASTNPETRRVLAAELNQLYQQTVQIANRKLAGKFLFGGFKTTKAPFDKNGDYSGDNGEIKLPIDKEAYVAINVPGSRVFLGKAIGDFLESDHSPVADPAETPEVDKSDKEDTTQPVVASRGPASIPSNRVNNEANNKEDPAQVEEKFAKASPRDSLASQESGGVNLFHLLKKVEIALVTGDKNTLQVALNDLDDAHSQVVLTRSELGSRLMNLNSTMESLSKAKVDNKAAISQLEDEDMFKAVSDVNKAESTLKATLATSSKLIQPSLLDFLK